MSTFEHHELIVDKHNKDEQMYLMKMRINDELIQYDSYRREEIDHREDPMDMNKDHNDQNEDSFLIYPMF